MLSIDHKRTSSRPLVPPICYVAKKSLAIKIRNVPHFTTISASDPLGWTNRAEPQEPGPFGGGFVLGSRLFGTNRIRRRNRSLDPGRH